MILTLFNELPQSEKDSVVKSLIEHSSPRQSFFFMVSLSILMATLGLITNSVVIVIGSMLIAPLLYPILSFSLGIVIADRSLMIRSLSTILRSSLYGIALSTATTFFFVRYDTPLSAEILARGNYSLTYVAIAFIAGLAASYAYLKLDINENMAGIAISVALIPPLAVIGIGLARLNWNLIQGSMILYLMNIFGILVASVLMFSIMNLQGTKKAAAAAVKKDDAQIKKDITKAEEASKRSGTV